LNQAVPIRAEFSLLGPHLEVTLKVDFLQNNVLPTKPSRREQPMGKKSRLSRDQKRKAKLAREAKRSQQTHSVLAYEGNKYKTDELVPVFFHTEMGIYESYVQSDRQLTDRDVEAALEKLIVSMRQGTLPPLSEMQPSGEGEDDEIDLIIWNIRRNWQELFQEQPRPGAEKLIGVLRTTLGSINTWSSPSPESRGYLSYLRGFLQKAGVSVDELSSERHLLPAPPEEELAAIGRAWCLAGEEEAADEFHALAEKMMRSGQAEAVVETCQELMGQTTRTEVIADLSKLSIMARQKVIQADHS
jgi:hypothetical protein